MRTSTAENIHNEETEYNIPPYFKETLGHLNDVKIELEKLYSSKNWFREDEGMFFELVEEVKFIKDKLLSQGPYMNIEGIIFIQQCCNGLQYKYEKLISNRQVIEDGLSDLKKGLSILNGTTLIREDKTQISYIRSCLFSIQNNINQHKIAISHQSAQVTGAKILDFPTKNNPQIKQNITASNDEFYELFENVAFLKAKKRIFEKDKEIRSDMQSKVSELIQERQPQQDFIKNATEKQRDAIHKIIKTDPSMGILKSDLNIMQAANDMSYQIEKEETQKTPEKPSSFWGKVKSGFKNLFSK